MHIAAPLRDPPTQAVLGVLDLSGLRERAHAHTTRAPTRGLGTRGHQCAASGGVQARGRDMPSQSLMRDAEHPPLAVTAAGHAMHGGRTPIGACVALRDVVAATSPSMIEFRDAPALPELEETGGSVDSHRHALRARYVSLISTHATMSEAANSIGLTRRTLYRRLQRIELAPGRGVRDSS